MEEVVYADLLFLIDFSMDFLTFYILTHILRQKAGLCRICSASAMGGIYSVLSLGIGARGFFRIFTDIFVCFVMCMTVFLQKNQKQFRRMPFYTAAFFTTSAMLGGIMTAIFSLLNRTLPNMELGREDLSLWVFGFVAIIGGLATLVGSDIIGRGAKVKSGRLSVKMGARKMSFDAISDSGNLLKDPIGGKDVVIVDRGKARQLVPGIEDAVKGKLPESFANRLRLIPIRTAAGEGMLAAFSPDEVVLFYNGNVKNIDVLIALSGEEMKNEGFEAIISADYFI